MNGLTYTEVILGILVPLILGAYGYSWMGARSLWEGIKDLRGELVAGLKDVRENEIQHLEDRIKRLEDAR